MKYPNGIKLDQINNQQINKKANLTNKRGLELENDINITNKYYADKKIAFIYKKPTPIKIVDVDYPTKQNKIGKIEIKKAYFEAPSTTDYNGIYKGRYIDFEAKETNNSKYFPLENIHKHQIKHLENITNIGGIGFIIVRFIKLNKTYLLFTKDLLFFINNYSRESIPISFFEEKGYLIKETFLPRLNYLDIIDLEVQYGKEK